MNVKFLGSNALIWGECVPTNFSQYTRRRPRLFGLSFGWLFIGVTLYQKENA